MLAPVGISPHADRQREASRSSSQRVSGLLDFAADGADARRLTEAQGSSYMPAWSPDGRSIAFVTNRDGDLEVYLMNADGSNQRNLTRNPGLDDGWIGPSW